MIKFIKGFVLLFVFAALSAISYASSGSISFGYGKTYQWDKFTQYNVRNVNLTTPASKDGYVIADWSATDWHKDWTNLTGWSMSLRSGTAEIVNNAVTGNTYAFHCKQSTDTMYTSVTKTAVYSQAGSNYAWAYFLSFPSICNSTSISAAYMWGTIFYQYDSASQIYINWRSTTEGWAIYDYNTNLASPNQLVKHATNIATDQRYHLWEALHIANGQNVTYVLDGTQVITDGWTFENPSLGEVDFQNSKRAGTNISESYMAYSRAYRSYNRYIAISSQESLSSDAVFDAGAGNAWDRINITGATENNTAITIEARTASIWGALSSAAYFTTTNNTTWDASNKKEFIQIRPWIITAQSGRYTPVLKDMTVYYNAAVSSSWLSKIWIF